MNLAKPEIAPFDPPTSKTPPWYNQTRSGSDDPSRRYGHLKYPQYGPNEKSVGQWVGLQYILLTLISYTPLHYVRNVAREE